MLENLLIALAAISLDPRGTAPGTRTYSTPAGMSLPAGVRLVRTIANSKDAPVRHVVFTGTDQEVVAVSGEGIHAWTVGTGTLRHTWPGVFLALALSPDGKTLGAVDAGGVVSLFDLASREPSWQFRFGGKAGPAESAALAFSPDGNLLAVGCRDQVEVWDLPRRRLLKWWVDHGPWRPGGLVQFYPDSRHLLVTGAPTREPTIWDIEAVNPRQVYVTLCGRDEHISILSPAGRLVAAGAGDSSGRPQLHFLLVRRGSCYLARLREMPTPARIHALAFSPDGRLLAAGCAQGQVLLVNASRLQAVATVVMNSAVHESLAFSPDGKLLAVGGADGRLRLWDVAGLVQRLAPDAEMSAERLEQLWRDLAERELDRRGDRAAVLPFIAAPEYSVPFLAQKLKPAQRPSAEYLARLLRQLDSPRFAEREQATRDLRALHGLIRSELQAALENSPNLEVRRRIESILRKLGYDFSNPEVVRQDYAIQILAEIGTPAAVHLLQDWARGERGAFLTEEARATLQDLETAKRFRR